MGLTLFLSFHKVISRGSGFLIGFIISNKRYVMALPAAHLQAAFLIYVVCSWSLFWDLEVACPGNILWHVKAQKVSPLLFWKKQKQNWNTTLCKRKTFLTWWGGLKLTCLHEKNILLMISVCIIWGLTEICWMLLGKTIRTPHRVDCLNGIPSGLNSVSVPWLLSPLADLAKLDSNYIITGRFEVWFPSYRESWNKLSLEIILEWK